MDTSKWVLARKNRRGAHVSKKDKKTRMRGEKDDWTEFLIGDGARDKGSFAVVASRKGNHRRRGS
ncbi:hypothetical protein F2Q70_00004988 [Brassica cretica]|uniref:Uncharacterized protein n=1 Tax=Brassica cretica TaxID=69181 RepID=A0A8S9ILN3_BRACR|nr:hypothetical protein F2Q70_00004988 [Brassica cretica]